MTHDEARRRLASTTDFEFRDGMVLLRDVRWLRAVAEIRAEGAAPGASMPRSSLPAVVMERAY